MVNQWLDGMELIELQLLSSTQLTAAIKMQLGDVYSGTANVTVFNTCNSVHHLPKLLQ
jgi:hypothetical protein